LGTAVAAVAAVLAAHLRPAVPALQKVIFTDSADFCAGPWNTASILFPSGSITNAA
jgi:hypothetical protein